MPEFEITNEGTLIRVIQQFITGLPGSVLVAGKDEKTGKWWLNRWIFTFWPAPLIEFMNANHFEMEPNNV